VNLSYVHGMRILRRQSQQLSYVQDIVVSCDIQTQKVRKSI
jgi:hypothetical protein